MAASYNLMERSADTVGPILQLGSRFRGFDKCCHVESSGIALSALTLALTFESIGTQGQGTRDGNKKEDEVDCEQCRRKIKRWNKGREIAVVVAMDS